MRTGLKCLTVWVMLGCGLLAPAAGQNRGNQDATRLAFEVATIKPAKPDEVSMNLMISPGSFTAEHASLRELIKFAYQIKSNDQLVGSPAWADNVYFDVNGKAAENEAGPVARENLLDKLDRSRRMLISLLEERCELRITRTTRELPVYSLAIAKGGPKMKESAGAKDAAGGGFPNIGRTGPQEVTAKNISMKHLAEWLSRRDDVGKRPVIDATGLTGDYDFTLRGLAGPQATATEVEAATSIFTALPEQLGLRLVAEKAPVDVLVVDQVKRPSEN